ncbi:MAG: hypothetical protein M3R48_01080 [Candidatus Dormibacteraeota bacterium]|nr:hypothetical protein [Candidatus Dormibacteraeota bacterium]
MTSRLAITFLFGLAATGCGGAATAAGVPPAPTQTATPPALLGTVEVAGLGTVLTDAQGRTLYYFTHDAGGHVACTGACAAAWPPDLAPATVPSAVPGIPGVVGVVGGSGGATQLTYNTWPLYTFAHDTGPGVATGQGVNDFFVATPSLTDATPTAAPTTAPPAPYHSAGTPNARPMTPRPTPCTIPQMGGGDGDSDNFGAPSDGDGCDR